MLHHWSWSLSSRLWGVDDEGNVILCWRHSGKWEHQKSVDEIKTRLESFSLICQDPKCLKYGALLLGFRVWEGTYLAFAGLYNSSWKGSDLLEVLTAPVSMGSANHLRFTSVIPACTLPKSCQTFCTPWPYCVTELVRHSWSISTW